ncbi:hypothetical protein [Caenispirillum bisanense]|uniref:PDC sensor domain-containing protein n=1 Tax=Caenispirillum bisanense TaxID=414052 RepID=UPI0031DBCE53
MWLSLAAIAIILAGIVGHVLKVRQATYDAAAAQSRVATDLLSQNAGRLLDSADFLVETVRERVAGRDWAAIAADRALWQSLRADAARFAHVDAVWLNDADGQLRLVSHAFPAPSSDASDRDFYRHFADSDDVGPYVSSPLVGRVTQVPTFLLTRRIAPADGGDMAGIVSVTLDSAFFASFLQTFALPYNASMALVRHQGDVLVAMPPSTAEDVRDDVLAVAVPGAVLARIDDDEQIGWVRSLEQWPLYAVVRFDRAAVDAVWIEAVTPYAVTGGLALLSLMVLAALAYAAERRRPE